MTGAVRGTEWTVELYETAKGERLVETEITDLGPDGVAKVYRAIERLNVQGLSAGAPLVEHIEGKIWQLRPDRYRALYFATSGRVFVVLRVFIKKSQKTPPREIRTAESRMEDYEARQGEAT